MQNKCVTSTEMVGKDNRNADICGNLMLSMWKQYERGNLKLFHMLRIFPMCLNIFHITCNGVCCTSRLQLYIFYTNGMHESFSASSTNHNSWPSNRIY